MTRVASQESAEAPFSQRAQRRLSDSEHQSRHPTEKNSSRTSKGTDREREEGEGRRREERPEERERGGEKGRSRCTHTQVICIREYCVLC